jgi:hypothetical protein
MKLIRASTLKVNEFLDSDTPPYAILSHTWVPDEEVSYQEMMGHRWKRKAGFQKIKQCCSQALKDGLEWVWVDTCSIDKTSSAELSEAINSMFRYYSQAAVCYAYLTDVDSMVPVSSSTKPTALIESFRKSRWFTRGWTLQELLAPCKLVFYSASWNSIGDRSEWQHEISRITSIHSSALTKGARNFTMFSIAHRMSWAASRTTSREEDMAYCLLGIFGVHMPLLYGEGKNAFIRLQEEIMKNSDDQTIFAWQEPEVIGNTSLGILSPSPYHFRNSRMVALSSLEKSQPYFMTNAGLQLTGILVYEPSLLYDDYVLCLPVYDEGNPDLVVGLRLKQLSENGDQFVRNSWCLMFFPTLELRQMKNISSRVIYVRKETSSLSGLEESIGRRLEFRIMLRENSQLQIRIEDSYPEGQVYRRPLGRVVVTPPEREGIANHLHRGTWHVAILLSVQIFWTASTPEVGFPLTKIQKVPALAFSENCRCVLFVGYNGRTDRSWCALGDTSDAPAIGLAQSSWMQLPKNVSEATPKWVFWRITSEDGLVGSKSSGVEISANLRNTKRQGLGTERASKKDITLGIVNLSSKMITSTKALTATQQ